ncbi:MAG: ion transporter [Kluyvera cryocrescens]|uniref:ion transporter n=1 Tax=Kluyvera cryocrescens TaxID=580 RepID=UPI000773C3B4|nr:ion transporter [Kluyvera cryocrescens]MCX2866608.1 ion transporter [Kluyvera cryocrescens]MDU5687105.1 ion transporter [Kluyvera cryocrescens]MEB7557885.1 ion transporter [Kluyvera cryocrescens]MEB7712703.1 ion transporter [Kluyvera cryocrescens]WNN73639.1 ion transporter [Kluyvera cryocrescens]
MCQPFFIRGYNVVAISALRHRLYHFLFDQRTNSSRRFEALCGLFALLSVIAIFIESGIGTTYHLTYDEWHAFVWLEIAFTLVFTLEYFLRLFCWPNPARYVFSFWGFIDLATILPFYVIMLWPEIGVEYLFAWRAMRVIRVLRILKLLRLMPALNSLWGAIVNSRHQLILFYVFISIVMIVAGALMYGIEGPVNGFTTLSTSVYWAIVTVTTVGYGDITPHTPAGRMVASVLILIGYSVIAIPTGIISAQLTNELQKRRQERVCPHCKQRDHEPKAHYCNSCGTALPNKL